MSKKLYIAPETTIEEAFEDFMLGVNSEDAIEVLTNMYDFDSEQEEGIPVIKFQKIWLEEENDQW